MKYHCVLLLLATIGCFLVSQTSAVTATATTTSATAVTTTTVASSDTTTTTAAYSDTTTTTAATSDTTTEAGSSKPKKTKRHFKRKIKRGKKKIHRRRSPKEGSESNRG
ncbi:GL22804 [Drosophila persimilis]|uniref:GL22804 n=1 Tax=Drosophila persimilis TaxID=7234 RepID=B4GZH2_DROPE|nr:protein new-glue 3 [Drosophila persimilis]EDW29399.1 GL22804 [Drosophila persimilis]